jgi:large subunit ribosomal protein L18
MKFSKRVLLTLKNKNKKLKPQKFKKLKRSKLRGLIKGNTNRPRMSVFRSNKHIYAQIIDDTTSQTLVSCSTLDRDIRLLNNNRTTCDVSKLIGEKIAKLSLKKNINQIVFDRGAYFYHGRIKALANGARLNGLQF